MRVLHSPVRSDTADLSETSSERHCSKLTADILPSCFLLGIIGGFSAFVAFGQAVMPAIIAAVFGALLGVFFACEEDTTHGPAGPPHVRK